MAKRFVPRFDQKKGARAGSPLSDELATALTACWTKTATAFQSALAAEQLKEKREDGKWIACDCQDQGVPSENPPVLMIGSKTSRFKPTTYYLYQVAERPRHASTCPFSVSEEEYERRAKARQTDQDDDSHTKIDLDKVPVLLGGLKGAATVASGESPTSGNLGHASSADDPLFTALAWLIEKSGINCCAEEVKSPFKQWAAIRKFADATKLEGDITFGNVLILGEKQLVRNAFQEKFAEIAARTPEDREVVAYLLFVADSLKRYENGSTSVEFSHWVQKEGKPHSETDKMVFHCDIKFPARDNDEAKAPYLVMIKLVQKRDGQARPSKGVAQPIYEQGNLFPVDSDQERKTYRKLLSIADYYRKRGGVMLIEKPVRGRNTNQGICRPDFIVWDEIRPAPEHTIIIETMGFDSDEYRERKARTTVIMREIGNTLIEDDRTGGKTDQSADDYLFTETMNALGAFAKAAGK